MEISKAFCEALPQLKLLDLKNNKIEQLPDEIQLLSSLVQLELANNNISVIPPSLSSLKSLVRFISNNTIKIYFSLSKNIFARTSLLSPEIQFVIFGQISWMADQNAYYDA